MDAEADPLKQLSCLLWERESSLGKFLLPRLTARQGYPLVDALPLSLRPAERVGTGIMLQAEWRYRVFFCSISSPQSLTMDIVPRLFQMSDSPCLLHEGRGVMDAWNGVYLAGCVGNYRSGIMVPLFLFLLLFPYDFSLLCWVLSSSLSWWRRGDLRNRRRHGGKRDAFQ